jgi:Uma2 family endonuclease
MASATKPRDDAPMVTAATKQPRPATEADLLALPEEGRGYELLDGELVERQAGFRHGRAQGRLVQRLEPYDRGSRGGDRPGGWWFVLEQLVRFGSGQTLRPDLAGWRRERLPEPPADQERVVHLRPDWIGEIISATNAGNDLVKKKRIYYQHGVPHYWLVDPRDETLTVLRWTPEGYTEVLVALRGERVRPEPFAAVEWLVGVLFGDDDDGAPSEG